MAADGGCGAGLHRELQLERLLGLTFPANVPSQRVLEKADFTYVRDAEWYGMTMREYVRERG